MRSPATKKPSAKPAKRKTLSATPNGSAPKPVSPPLGDQNLVGQSMGDAAQTVKPVTPGIDNRFLKKHLVEKVAAKTGARKNELRPIVDAVLAEIGDALSEDAELVLQPLGKLIVKRTKDVGNATVFTCRIRRTKKRAIVTTAVEVD